MENKENIKKIINKYQKTTIEKNISEYSRYQLTNFINKIFSMDNKKYANIEEKRKIKKIFDDWNKKYYHTAEERNTVFTLVNKILSV